MLPLKLDDLIPLDEFAGKRREFFESHRRYVDRYRRVRIGPQASLLFENRQTLWFRVQDVLGIARLSDSRAVQTELDLFNRLLPAPGQLQACLLIDVNDAELAITNWAAWQELSSDHVRMCLGHAVYGGCLVTCRPEDRCLGAAHWLQFDLGEVGRQQLADLRVPAALEIALPAYHFRSPQLSQEIRQSLIDDLKISPQRLKVAA